MEMVLALCSDVFGVFSLFLKPFSNNLVGVFHFSHLYFALQSPLRVLMFSDFYAPRHPFTHVCYADKRMPTRAKKGLCKRKDNAFH